MFKSTHRSRKGIGLRVRVYLAHNLLKEISVCGTSKEIVVL